MKSFIVLAVLAAAGCAQGPPPDACGQTCENYMVNLYASLGCSSNTDYSCLCSKVNFLFGLRDCNDQACGGNPANTNAYEALCHGSGQTTALSSTSFTSSTTTAGSSSSSSSGSGSSSTGSSPTGSGSGSITSSSMVTTTITTNTGASSTSGANASTTTGSGTASTSASTGSSTSGSATRNGAARITDFAGLAGAALAGFALL